MIELKNIIKTFKVTRRDSKNSSVLKALFQREYEIIYALKDISFQINEGEMVGYIGPNGAGKSSTIKVMSGILTPDSGECLINGYVPWKQRTKHVAEIGVVFGQRSQLWWDIPVIDSFYLLKDIYDVDDKRFKCNLDLMTDLLDISEIIKTPTRQLSLGQRMRCEIIASLLHNPKILFLDEPTIGLDAVSKRAVRQFIQDINRENKTTVILTTHDMQDIEALTERIIMIGKGKILLDGQLSDIKSTYDKTKTLIVDYKGVLPELCEGVQLINDINKRATLAINTDRVTTGKTIAFLSNHIEIEDIEAQGIPIEDFIVQMYKEHQI